MSQRNIERARNQQLEQINQNTQNELTALRKEMAKKEQEIARRNKEIEEWRQKVSNKELEISRVRGESTQRLSEVSDLRRQVTQRDSAILRDMERSQVYITPKLLPFIASVCYCMFSSIFTTKYCSEPLLRSSLMSAVFTFRAVGLLDYTVDTLERDAAAPSRTDERSPFNQDFRDAVRQFSRNSQDRGAYFREMIERAYSSGDCSPRSDEVTRRGYEWQTE